MSRKKIKINKIALSWIIIVLAFLFMGLVVNSPADSVLFDILYTLDMVAFIGIIGLIIAFCLYIVGAKAEKSKKFSQQTEQVKEVDTRSTMRYNLDEQAIECTHSIGKEKYFDQLDDYLANGLIDKNEYRVLKKRYEKLDIPDNMH